MAERLTKRAVETASSPRPTPSETRSYGTPAGWAWCCACAAGRRGSRSSTSAGADAARHHRRLRSAHARSGPRPGPDPVREDSRWHRPGRGKAQRARQAGPLHRDGRCLHRRPAGSGREGRQPAEPSIVKPVKAWPRRGPGTALSVRGMVGPYALVCGRQSVTWTAFPGTNALKRILQERGSLRLASPAPALPAMLRPLL
jgi:hypothetical protein